MSRVEPKRRRGGEHQVHRGWRLPPGCWGTRRLWTPRRKRVDEGVAQVRQQVCLAPFSPSLWISIQSLRAEGRRRYVNPTVASIAEELPGSHGSHLHLRFLCGAVRGQEWLDKRAWCSIFVVFCYLFREDFATHAAMCCFFGSPCSKRVRSLLMEVPLSLQHHRHTKREVEALLAQRPWLTTPAVTGAISSPLSCLP